MTDDDPSPRELVHNITHLQHRLNQALEAAIDAGEHGSATHQAAALAELDAVGDEIDAILDAYENEQSR